jgi:2-oxoglutarate dehydrogenase E2 component (dihydrolipoamide succinyltransferase)
MAIEIKVPQLPESVADATLVAWHRKAGDPVRRDENLVDLETDKVVLEVPSPTDGIVKEIRVFDGATVTSGQVLDVVEPGEAAGAGAAAAAGEAPADEARAAGPVREARPSKPEARVEPEARPAAEPRAKPAADGGGRMGPAARNLIEEHDLDASEIVGTGRDGRISKADVLSHLASQRDTNLGLASVEAEAPAAEPSAEAAHHRIEQRVAMSRLRRRIAERLVEAQQTAAMLTTFNEVDMSAIMSLRKRYQEQFQKRYDIKLGFMSFFVRASIESLKAFPLLNASVDGDDVVYHEYFDIGVAVSTDRGLLVPVLRDAQAMSFAEIERVIADFGTRAQSGAINMEELTGGTFTITNGGVFGSMMSTPILNPPQSGILGMHAILERPVVVDGQIVARPMMYVALTYDHRIIDGRDAVQFLVHLKQQLEDPARLILQV